MTPPVDAAQLAAVIAGHVSRIVGDTTRVVGRPAALDAATEDEFAFCSGTGTDAAERVAASGAGVVLCRDEEWVTDAGAERTLILVDEPRLAFIRALRALYPEERPQGVHPTAVVSPRAEIDPTAFVGPFAVVGAAFVGARTILESHVHVADRTRIGSDVTIGPGTVIGTAGFGYHRDERGGLEGFPHLGGVVIEDRVDVGANVCIDRGTLGDTRICAGARIDNLVHVAHNAVIGRDAAVIANAMIGGSTQIGDRSWIAPSATLRDVVSIGADAVVGLGAVVTKDVPDGETVIGAPARPAAEFKALQARLKQLGEE